MSNLIPLDEAARMLGLEPSKLNDLRLKNAILGVRDGASWKFKKEEIQRYAQEHGVQGNGGDDMEFELSSDEISSGAIEISDSAEAILKDSDSIDLSDEIRDSEELSFGSSDISLAAESVLEADSDELDSGPSGTNKGDDLLSEKDALLNDDSVELASDFDESDLVLDDSDSSDEVALEANDSGINLSPTDSGISLEEEPMELGGSDIDSLELPEDDDAISLEEAADYDSATEMRAEDDFNLTPLEESLEDESSGSQVIALEDSDLFADDSAPTMLGDSDVVAQPALIPDDSTLESQLVAAQPGATVAAVPEAPYSMMQVLSLAGAFVITMLCALVAFDLARNLWQGADSAPLSATVMNFFVELVGWRA